MTTPETTHPQHHRQHHPQHHHQHHPQLHRLHHYQHHCQHHSAKGNWLYFVSYPFTVLKYKTCTGRSFPGCFVQLSRERPKDGAPAPCGRPMLAHLDQNTPWKKYRKVEYKNTENTNSNEIFWLSNIFVFKLFDLGRMKIPVQGVVPVL